jgi:glycosyltransferase involved in cell wall biosynthesis
MAVRYKRSKDPEVFTVPNQADNGLWARTCLSLGEALAPYHQRIPGARRLTDAIRITAYPKSFVYWWKGLENYDFPGSWKLLEAPPSTPDVVHCHNLDGDYFDLRVLPWLSNQSPVVFTLHSAWLLSGHCAHSLDCDRWKIGCGQCPDLKIPPAIRRDSTAYNWERKREIFSRCRLYVATPSRWLMQKVEQSILAPAIEEARVIPNGVDLSVFHPGDKQTAREALGIPQEAKVLLFATQGGRKKYWRDYATIYASVARVSERLRSHRVFFVFLGEDAPAERIGQAEALFVPYQKNPRVVARYFQSADLYLHASKAETFSTAVLESLACGTPVVATAIGGTPEQVKSTGHEGWHSALQAYYMDEATGVLVPAADAEAMAEAAFQLLTNEALRDRMGNNAAQDVLQRFDLESQVEAYLKWYQELRTRQAVGI